MPALHRPVRLFRPDLRSSCRTVLALALVPLIACGSAATARADDPVVISVGNTFVNRVSVGTGAPRLAPAGGDVRLGDDLSLGRGVMIVLPETSSADTPSREVALRPTDQSPQAAAGSDLGVRPAGLANNYRGTAFVPWLETLSLVSDAFGGYAGSPGLHSQWSSEIDQWVAMVGAPGALGPH